MKYRPTFQYKYVSYGLILDGQNPVARLSNTHPLTIVTPRDFEKKGRTLKQYTFQTCEHCELSRAWLCRPFPLFP